jgi:para-nitrobenzyl esterase
VEAALNRILPIAIAVTALSCGVQQLDSTIVPEGDQTEDEFLALTSCQVASPTDPLTVATTRGAIRGERAGNTLVFRGVPFAAPPVGALRFKPTAAHACWSGVLDATRYGSKCPQQGLTDKHAGNEDCLFLNLWTPSLASTSSSPRPVLFFIHGGAQVLGSSNDGLGTNNYDGQVLAEQQNAVVVSVNYRLGALGFLAHPALDAENARHVSGNYGLHDQIAALKWVKANIARFGGDPARVMVFGESAGAFNTCALVASPLATNLLSTALMQSGVCHAPTMQYRELKGVQTATDVGCAGAADVAACLRSASLDDLVKTGRMTIGGTAEAGPIDFAHLADMTYGASVDGWVLNDSPIRTIKAGQHNKVPLVVGSNAEEMDLFLTQGSVASCAKYEDQVRTGFGAAAPKVLSLYPCRWYSNPTQVMSDAMGDLFFTCTARRTARAMTANQSEPVFRYLFTHRRWLGLMAGSRSVHTAELPFVFHRVGQGTEWATFGELALADAIGGYWGRFAASGLPQGAGARLWERYVPARDNSILLDEQIAMTDGIRTEKCDFWDTLAQD